jgi:hypothetical protein
MFDVINSKHVAALSFFLQKYAIVNQFKLTCQSKLVTEWLITPPPSGCIVLSGLFWDDPDSF